MPEPTAGPIRAGGAKKDRLSIKTARIAVCSGDQTRLGKGTKINVPIPRFRLAPPHLGLRRFAGRSFCDGLRVAAFATGEAELSGMPKTVGCFNVALLGCLVLAGCGGSSLAPSELYDAKYDRYYAIDERSELNDYTPENAMPSSGAATYRGVGYVTYSENGQKTGVLGDATIRADFGNNNISGTMSNFVGGPIINETVEDVTVFSGNLGLNGTIGAAGGGCNACYTGQLVGTLAGQGDTIQIDSRFLGDFYGQNHETIGGFTPSSETVLVNGVRTTGGAVLVAER